MVNLCSGGILVCLLVCGMAPSAFAKTLGPPAPPNNRYVLPGAAAGSPADRLGEGRSIYQMEAPSTFWYGVDERGNPSGLPENQIGRASCRERVYSSV